MLRVSGGVFKNFKVNLQHKSVKPTSELVRLSLFNSIHIEGLSFLDMFCGSGIVGLEALSRGASFVCFVDKDPSLISLLSVILKDRLGVEKDRYRLIKASWEKGTDIIIKDGMVFDIVFADPFYDFKSYQSLLSKLSLLLRENSTIILETSSRVELTYPSNLTKIDEKVYGETTLHFFVKR